MKIKNKNTGEEFTVNGSINWINTIKKEDGEEVEIMCTNYSFVNDSQETFTESFVEGEVENENFLLLNL